MAVNNNWRMVVKKDWRDTFQGHVSFYVVLAAIILLATRGAPWLTDWAKLAVFPVLFAFLVWMGWPALARMMNRAG